MMVSLEPWAAFFGLVIVMFTIDLMFGSRGTNLRAAMLWSAIWVGAGLAFGLWIWAIKGGEVAAAYYAAYILEKSLSVDNIFVFVLIFSQLRIPAHQQHRVLLLGIVGALVMRALMIGGGVYLLQRFHWVIYPFAGLLLVAAVRLLFGESAERRFVEESCAACSTWVARIIPVTPVEHGQRFIVREQGKLMATPMFVALILIETTDLIFALELHSGGPGHHARSLHRLYVQYLRPARPARALLCPGRRRAALPLSAPGACGNPLLCRLQDAFDGNS